MCCPCNHCGKCADRQGRCIVCHERLTKLFAPVCEKCGAPQPPPPGARLPVSVNDRKS